MMADQARLRFLLQRYARDTCSREQMEELFGYIREARQDEQLNEALSEEWQVVMPDDSPEGEDWDEMFQKIIRSAPVEGIAPQRRIRFFKTALIRFAAVFLIIAGAIVYFFYSRTEAVDNIVKTVDISPGGNRAVLTLADGMIMFYSGEPGAVYDFKGRTSADGMSQMQFTSYVQAGTQTGSLALLVSTDFDGTYSGTGISGATWTDITSQATLSTGDKDTPSDIIDLSSFINDDKPVYFAFKYTGATGSAQNTWTIKNFGINLVMPDGSTFVTANMTTAGWKAVNVKNPAKAWAVSASQLQIAGGDENAEDNEDWLITAPLALNKVNPDRGVPIKDISILLDEFSYIYSTPGVYKAVFEAFNAAGTTQKSAQREIEITIR